MIECNRLYLSLSLSRFLISVYTYFLFIQIPTPKFHSMSQMNSLGPGPFLGRSAN